MFHYEKESTSHLFNHLTDAVILLQLVHQNEVYLLFSLVNKDGSRKALPRDGMWTIWDYNLRATYDGISLREYVNVLLFKRLSLRTKSYLLPLQPKHRMSMDSAEKQLSSALTCFALPLHIFWMREKLLVFERLQLSSIRRTSLPNQFYISTSNNSFD
jgi:hypothetical protein